MAFVPRFQTSMLLLDIFNAIYYYQKQLGINYLFLIGLDGISKYDMDAGVIVKSYHHNIFQEFWHGKICINPDDDIIYIQIKCKIITFDIKNERFDTNFLNYENKIIYKSKNFEHSSDRFPLFPIICTGLVYIPSPVKETRMQLSFDNGTSRIYKIIKKQKLRAIQRIQKQKTNFSFNSKYMDNHLYILTRQLIIYQDIDSTQILKNLFKIRSYLTLKKVHFAWNQVIFFIFVENSLFPSYVIDCVDVSEPNTIYFDIKRFEVEYGLRFFKAQTFCFDQNNTLHHLNYRFSIHSRIPLMELIPTEIVTKNKEKNLSLIKQFCLFHSRKFILMIPTVLFIEINRFYPLFKSF